MNKLHLLMISTLAALGVPQAAAASFDYDILVVACDRNNCSKVAERTIVGGSGSKTAFRQHDFMLEIEALALRGQELDAKVSLDFLPSHHAGGGWVGSAGSNQRVQVLVDSCTLKPGVFSSLAALASGGRTYHAWVRLAVR